MQTVKFYTLGCKVNQYDTQDIRERFIKAGFKEIINGEKADAYVINTCTVTAVADRKSRSFIHRAYFSNPKAKIVVTGCYTELDSDKIAKIPGVTHIVKNKDKNRIVELLNPVRDTTNLDNNPMVSNGVNEHNEPNENNETGVIGFSGHTRAFLKIQDGCNNFCSYCKVPLARGISRSKPLDKIIQEASQLTKNGLTPLETIGKQGIDEMSLTGFKEIVLCGICLGAYGRDLVSAPGLVDVIEALEEIDGLLRIRLSSIEAGDVSGELIQKMAQSKKLCRHLHIPIQSGDDGILKRMNRGYKASDYLNLIERIKKRVPGIAITTDVMVGFSGESDENFQNTVRLIKEVLPLRTHIFPYSRREGTHAARNFNEKTDYKIIKERVSFLKQIAQACSLDFKKQFFNKSMGVLIEEPYGKDKRYWRGYADNYIKVLVKSSLNLKNQFISVKLNEITKDYALADFEIRKKKMEDNLSEN